MVARIGKATDGIGIRLYRYSNEKDVDAAEATVSAAQAEISGGASRKNDPILIAAEMTKQLQTQIDVRYPRTDLHPDDPVRLADPASARVFWDGSDVVERTATVEVSHDGTEYVPRIKATR